ncbi:G2484-1 protein isoform X2 [Wolffia australiana]
MDYDGNDFQNQNFQLNGEDNNRFSSGLRSFSLPKFELEDHFQVSLRFDGLVEPEPLIDIRDQDERDWIEDFSSSNASLDFNSVPADPCSISRRKNVWSEATSSESVDILLKSVGEDDVIHKRTFFIDLTSQNDLIDVDNHTVSGCFQEETKAMKAGSVLLTEESKKELTDLHPDTLEDSYVVSSSGDGVNRRPDVANPSSSEILQDDCGRSEVITGTTDVSFVSKEHSPDGGNGHMTSGDSKSDDNSVEKTMSSDQSALVGEATQGVACLTDSALVSVNISEKDPDSLTSNSRAVDPGSEGSVAFVSELSQNVPESLSDLDMKMKPSPLLMDDYNKHEITEKDGLLEDVAHQIENLSKVNSSSGQVVTLNNQTSTEVNSVEGGSLEDAKKLAWLAKTGSLESPVESCELRVHNNLITDDSLVVNESVVVPEEDEDTLKPLPEREKEVGSQVAVSDLAQKKETDGHDPTSSKAKLIPSVPESTETLKRIESDEDKKAGITVDGESACLAEKIVPEVDGKSGNVNKAQVQNGELSEKCSAGSELDRVESSVENVRPPDSADLKSNVVEKPLESSGHEEKSHQSAHAPVEDDPIALEPVCGSPTIISYAKSYCGQLEEQELDKQSSDKQPSETAPAVDFVENSSSREPKDACSSEERTFTFNVGSRNASEESPISGWKSFSAMEPLGTLKNEERNSTASGLRKGNATEFGESDPIDVSTKKAHKDKSKAASSPSERSTSRKRSHAKETSAHVETSANLDVGPGEERYQQSSAEGGGLKQSDSSVGPTLGLQPFTDEQQVQLRAQIYVYGYLIQGIPPDEACMVAAFGNNDSARSAWEGTWRISLERFRGPKSPSASFATPLPSHAGPRIQEQSPRSVVQSKPPMTPITMTASRSIGKCSSAVISNLMPLSSPTWQDASQSSISRDPSLLSPTHGFQSSQSKHCPPSGCSSWLPPASSIHLIGPSPTPVPFSVPSPPSVLDKGTTPFLKPPTAEATTPMSIRDFAATSSVPALQAEPASEKKTASTNHKSRKMKKGDDSSMSEHEISTSLPESTHSQSDIVVFPSVPPPTHFQVVGNSGKEQRVILSEETCSKIELSRLQAEDAAAFSAAAVRHSEGIWAQLAIQRNSGLASEIEVKLAAAAVAAAAASSVAKAAAAAAKVASDAAMQAKLMADEAVTSKTIFADQGANLLKGTERATASTVSVISAAKEVARRRVEAASAASKQAENLDAILRAAELAAVAVCQAGAVVAMGDPLPFTLNDLIEAGPEGHWKAPSSTDTNTEKRPSLDFVSDVSNNDAGLGQMHDNLPTVDEGRLPEESAVNLTEPENIEDRDEGSLNERYIQEGSLVEVLLDKDNARIWYSANVLYLKDGEAYVNYNDLPPDSGVDEQKEWVPLIGLVDRPPRIRLAHPLMTVKNEGTKKRRRAAAGNYLWAVGDRVDASIHNGWCEGVVTEKNKEDETKLTVHFSGGEISTIRAWQLRPSLVWKDGQWVEWSRLRENTCYAYEGDTPKDKRQKVSRPEGENYPKFKGVELHEEPATIQQPVERRPLLGLSEKEKIFSFGKTAAEVAGNPPRRLRSGPKDSSQSRVVFGIPKPGKKRKFMEVSKHYDKPEATTKYLLPGAPTKSRKVPESRPPKAIPRPEEKHHRQPEKGGFGESEPPSSSTRLGAGPAGGSKKKAPVAVARGRAVERAQSEERHGSVVPEIGSELRRSNRRIQPTSRLLEGLQSSMIAPKVASVAGPKASSKHPPPTKHGKTEGDWIGGH